MEKLVKRGR